MSAESLEGCPLPVSFPASDRAPSPIGRIDLGFAPSAVSEFESTDHFLENSHQASAPSGATRARSARTARRRFGHTISLEFWRVKETSLGKETQRELDAYAALHNTLSIVRIEMSVETGIYRF